MYYRTNFVKKTIEKNYSQWNMLRYQNTTESGDYLGFLYEQNYNINTLPKNYVLYLLINYYITYDSDFFTDYNEISDSLYQKEVTKELLNQKLKEMFGPDYPSFDIQSASYNCSKSITKKDDNTFIIQSKHPEVCGAFDDTKDQYLTHMKNYFKENDRILININVAYMSLDNERIVLYSNKDKKEVLNFDYSHDCLDSINESCYKTFQNYQVVLRKASDNNYYFYSISKA